MKKKLSFIYVDNEESLLKAYKDWEKADVIGVDVECENNLHHYGAYISLFQISDGRTHWIVDVLKLKDKNLLIKMLEKSSIQKIFHDVSFDLRIINFEFKCKPINIFDTQIAALLLGQEDTGLSSLLEKYFKVKKERKFQMADWTRRPLREDMLQYAIKDTIYLIQLRNILKKELRKKGRLSWAEDEFDSVENSNLTLKEPAFEDLRGFRLITDQQRAIVKRIYLLRESLAKKVNRPVHYIMNAKLLLENALHPPNNISVWKSMRSVHPIVKKNAKEFMDEVDKGKHEKITIVENKKKRYNFEQRHKMQELNDRRDNVSKKLELQKYLIMNKDQMQDIVLTGNYDCLRPWQKKEMGY